MRLLKLGGRVGRQEVLPPVAADLDLPQTHQSTDILFESA